MTRLALCLAVFLAAQTLLCFVAGPSRRPPFTSPRGSKTYRGVHRSAVGSAQNGRPPPGFSESFGGFEDSFYKPLDRSGFKGPVPTATRAWFYALTNIRIRESPDVSSRALGTVVRQGETFEAGAFGV
eukprot:symbB.v1.2.037430.t1/scaffold5506.1/size26365/2